MPEKNEHDYTPDEYDQVMAEASADAPPSKPCIELDEASGRDLTEHAQEAVHVLGRTLAEMGKVILRGDHHPEQIKIGFDYGVSMAYVEVDLLGMAVKVRDKLEQSGLRETLDSITVDEGVYAIPSPDADRTDVPRRPVFQSSPVSTVRLYLHSIGVSD